MYRSSVYREGKKSKEKKLLKIRLKQRREKKIIENKNTSCVHTLYNRKFQFDSKEKQNENKNTFI